MNKTAIIIVTYNAEEYIKSLFESLAALRYPRKDFEIFVVDNASDDNTIQEIRELVDLVGQETKRGTTSNISNNRSNISNEATGISGLNLELIKNKENLGFAGGNNIGIKQALNGGYDYIILLNQDMEVDEDWLTELVRKAESDSRIGVVQAMMLLMRDRGRINATGERLNYIGIGHSGNYRLPLSKFKPESNVISYASGAAVLFKRGVLEEVGLFDESFFMYGEDADLSFRARLLGWDIVLADKAKCWHDYHFNKNPKTYYWTEKNRLAFLLKNFEFKTLILISLMFIIMEWGMLMYALTNRWFGYKIKSYEWVLKNLSRILESRREIQKSRKVRDGELKKYLVAGIEFGGLENSLLKLVANPVMKGYWWLVKRLI